MVFWIVFHLCIISMLWIDLRFGGRSKRKVFSWIALALAFNGYVFWRDGAEAALTFFTAYVVELSLSVDNMAIFFLIFSSLGIAHAEQNTILLYGVLGAFFFRIVCILAGISLLQSFSLLYPVFGVVLCISAWINQKEQKVDIQSSFVFKTLNKWISFEKSDVRGKFWITKDRRKRPTTLCLALILVELFDAIFAVDSVPAVLSITQDPFLAYTSNVFAVLGLRSLYLVLKKWVKASWNIQSAISSILFFIGGKMIISPWVEIPTVLSLGILIAILLLFVWLGRKRKAS